MTRRSWKISFEVKKAREMKIPSRRKAGFVEWKCEERLETKVVDQGNVFPKEMKNSP